MTLSRAALFLGALAGCGSAQTNRLSPAEQAAGWQLMFDGRTFAGWEDPALKKPLGTSFAIEDGCLKAMPKPSFGEDLFTTATFNNFEMAFEWKIPPGGNSGVKYRVQDRVVLDTDALKTGMRFEDVVALSIRNRRGQRIAGNGEYVVAFEYQVIDNGRHADAKRGAKSQAGALYDVAAAERDATRPVGEFNQARIRLRGNHAEHWVNGVKVMDTMLDAPAIAAGLEHRWGTASPVYRMLTRQPRRNCPITLQNHGDAAWFRNLKIRRLD